MKTSACRLVRRDFLKASACAAAASLWRPVPRVAAGEVERQAARFSFVQVNDLHVQAPWPEDAQNVPRTYARANDKARWCIEAINGGPQPDFVLGIGDLVHGERLDRLAADLETFQQVAQPLRAKLYPGVGNHEVIQQEGSAAHERAYRETFGQDRVNYTFEHGGLLFIMLNNSGATVVSAEIIRKRNAWLRDVLQKHRDKKKILGCHIPIVPVRDEPVLAKSFGFRSYQAHDRELLDLVDQHAETIAAVLSGHLHLTGFIKRGGVHHISIAGTASYPSDYARFAVYDDRIDMEVCQLPAELATAHPSIHGQPRHPADFTDADHATGEEYMIGRADERRLTIPLA